MLSCSLALRSRTLAAALGLAAFGAAAVHPAFAQTSVLTQNNDNARTGSNTAETVLTPQNVKTATFGKLFTITGLNANVDGQVLYVPSVTIGGVTRNVVYAYTSNNTDNSPCGVYAYDADTGTQLWKNILPSSATYTTATPVIDPATSTLYVLTKGPTDDTGVTYLHAFDITTGADKPGSPVQVRASAPGKGDGAVNGVVSFDGPASSGRFHANDRAALLLANGQVYTSFAHNSDSFPYHGWVLAYKYDGTKFTQTAVFCTTPNGSDGGIWQAGKGLTADASGNIYFSVGNGTFDANKSGSDYGMCYLKLSPTLQVLDYFAPFDEQSQSNGDLDLGNSGLSGLPGTTALFGGGTKFGSAFLFDSANLGKFTPNGPDKTLARVDGVSGNDQVGQNSIAWDSGSYKYVYLWPGGQTVEQFRYDPSVGNFNPKGIFTTGGTATNGGSLAVSSSGTSNAILWAVGDEGTVRAYDATNVANPELWDSAQNASRDSIGHTGHFQFPTVVNGKVYVPTGGSTIAVYGLLPSATPAPPAGILAATQVRFAPRPGYESRMVGGKFQGSADGNTYVNLATITQTPASGQFNTLTFSTPAAYRYLRYLGPNSGYGNIAELEFDSGTGSSLAKISGSPFGTPGSYQNNGNDITKVFDGNFNSFFDAPLYPGNGDFVGIDQAAPVTQVRFAPRPGYESRMIGGQFQGSSDGITYTTLATITQAPPDNQLTTLTFASPASYRFLRYLAPSGAYGNISELEFDSGTGASVAKISGLLFGTAGSWANQGNDYTKAFDGNTGTFFDAPDPGNGDFVGIDRGSAAGSAVRGTPIKETTQTGAVAKVTVTVGQSVR